MQREKRYELGITNAGEPAPSDIAVVRKQVNQIFSLC
jgi:hypothetical protein